MLRLVFVLKAWRRGCRPVGPGVEAVPCGPHFTSCLIPRLVGEIPSGLLIRFRPWKRAGRLHSIEKARADLMPSQASEGSSNTAPWAALDEEESGREFLCRPFSEQVAPPLRHMVPHRSALRKGSGTVVRLSRCSSTPIKAPRVLSLGDTAQSAETVGNRLSFVDKIPSQAPSMHEPEDADAEDADDDDEACSRRRRHGVPGRAAQNNHRTSSVRSKRRGLTL